MREGEKFKRDEFEKVIIKKFNLKNRYRGMEKLDMADGRYLLTDLNKYWDIWKSALVLCNPELLEGNE